MADANDGIIRKPEWSQGLALRPEHFQAQDRYHEQLVDFNFRHAFDRPWGVIDLAIDLDALASGHIVLRRLSALLPDGTPVIVGAGGNATVMPRSFESQLRARSAIDVYIGVPYDVAGRPSAGDGASDTPARYVKASAMVTDFNTGRKAIEIPWMSPNARVLFDGERETGFSAVRIARLVRTESGRVELDARHAPPVMHMHAAPALEASARAVEKALLGTRALLSDQRPTNPDLSGADAARIVLLTVIGGLLPRLSAALSPGAAHPREAYLVLAEIVGALSALTPLGRPASLSYDFLDLAKSFEQVSNQALEILALIGAPRHREVPMQRREEHFWYAELREPGIFSKEFLLVLSGGDPTQIRQVVPRMAKVSAADELGAIVSASVAGVTLIPETRRPAGLPGSAQAVAFRLDRQSAHWANVVKKGTLGVFIPQGFTQCTVSLYTEEPGVLG